MDDEKGEEEVIKTRINKDGGCRRVGLLGEQEREGKQARGAERNAEGKEEEGWRVVEGESEEDRSRRGRF